MKYNQKREKKIQSRKLTTRRLSDWAGHWTQERGFKELRKEWKKNHHHVPMSTTSSYTIAVCLTDGTRHDTTTEHVFKPFNKRNNVTLARFTCWCRPRCLPRWPGLSLPGRILQQQRELRSERERKFHYQTCYFSKRNWNGKLTVQMNINFRQLFHFLQVRFGQMKTMDQQLQWWIFLPICK